MTPRIPIAALLLLLVPLPAAADPSGTPEPVGEEFQVNTYTTGSQAHSAVAVDAGADFVVVWTSYGSSGSDSSGGSIQGQRYDSTGAAIAGEFQVNTYTTSRQLRPAVAAGVDGDFVVVWTSYGSSGSDSQDSSVQGQRYDSTGAAIGGEFQVNTTTSNRQETPVVAADAGGNFIVVWESQGSSGSDSLSWSVQGQRYDPTLAPIGGEFQVNTYTSRHQDIPSVSATADGDFVVVWESYGSSGSDSSSWSVQGQRFDSAGTAVGDQFQVNTYTTSSQELPVVAAVAGDFVVGWASFGANGADPSSSSVQGRRPDAAGAAVGDEFLVNTYTTNGQGAPAVAADGGGHFVAVWQSNGSSGSDSDPRSVQGQRFVNPIFADSFESGDTSAWSTAVP